MFLARPRWRRPGCVVPLFLSAVYLAAALPYSLLTRAWEANDELDHTRYIEYIVAHGALPRISVANGHESHQPPLYYLMAAGWQKLLGVPAFTPSATANPRIAAEDGTGRFLELLHNYTPVQHRDAVYLHEIRLLSVLFGLATVLVAYGCARMLLTRASAALATGLVVALFPKQLVVDSVVTNDSLVITLCALALFLFLQSEKARREGGSRRRAWLVLAMGTALGLAAITKYNSLPVAGLLLVLTAIPAVRQTKAGAGRGLVGRGLVAPGLAGTGFLATSLWWFIRNKVLYGQFLASRASLAYLRAWLAPLVVPVPWTNTHRFLHFVPAQLFRSTWYDGGWNQFALPKWMSAGLWALAAVSIVSAGAAFRRRATSGSFSPWVSGPALWATVGSVLAGIAAVLIIAKTTTQAEGRVAFVGLVGFALLLVVGTDAGRARGSLARAAVFAWPAMLLGVNVYVAYSYLVPFRGL